VPIRVIAGEFRGRTLRTGVGRDVRPTADRVRETVFDMLSARAAFPCAAAVDVCAGSGAMGIEALSRGAARVVFVEKDATACAIIEANLATLGVRERARIVQADAAAALAHLADAPFDVAFVDPPYASRTALALLQALARGTQISAGGWCVVEHARKEEMPDRAGACARVAQRRFGETVIDVYSRGDPPAASHVEGEST
jgi:16S rRNA (guanine(966)-N(2))-methyltransferase RsmD